MNTFLKYCLHSFVLILLCFLFLSGVGRDDVRLYRYYAFAQDPVFNCIGEMYYKKKKEFVESCVLIDSNHIMLAAHGLFMDSDSMVVDSITVLNRRHAVERPAYSYLPGNYPYYFKFNGKKFYVNKISLCPYYDDGFNSLGFNDVAIIELSEAVKGIQPAILYTDSNELHARGIACGYGDPSKAMGSGIFLHSRKKMAGENMIDSLGGNKINGQWGAMYADMDHPRNAYCNRMGLATPLPLEWHSNGGDCGSGLFILKDNTWQLAGISFGPSYFDDWKRYSEKYGYYGFVDGWTRVSPLVPWIQGELK